jgi:hypothetical protein
MAPVITNGAFTEMRAAIIPGVQTPAELANGIGTSSHVTSSVVAADVGTSGASLSGSIHRGILTAPSHAANGAVSAGTRIARYSAVNPDRDFPDYQTVAPASCVGKYPYRVWRNHYQCQRCPNEWSDEALVCGPAWCPSCDRATEPYDSIDLLEEA